MASCLLVASIMPYSLGMKLLIRSHEPPAPTWTGHALTEDVKGVVPQAVRQKVMRKVIEAETLAYAHVVDRQDIEPRNFILKTRGLECFDNPNMRVVLIDFARPNPKDIVDFASQAIPPAVRWHESVYLKESFDICGWIDWEWQPWLEQCFPPSKEFALVTPSMEELWLGEDAAPLLSNAYRDMRHYRYCSATDGLSTCTFFGPEAAYDTHEHRFAPKPAAGGAPAVGNENGFNQLTGTGNSMEMNGKGFAPINHPMRYTWVPDDDEGSGETSDVSMEAASELTNV